MVKRAKTATPTATHELRPERTECAHCGKLMWADYASRRTLATLQGLVRLVLTVRRCRHQGCPAFHKPYRPEVEGRFASPRVRAGRHRPRRPAALRLSPQRPGDPRRPG